MIASFSEERLTVHEKEMEHRLKVESDVVMLSSLNKGLKAV